jgi:hypothetical protein
MLKMVNTTLQDMYERGVEVWNQPVMGAPELKLIFPKNILRVGDFPGPHFNLPACGWMMARKLS